MGFQYLGDDGFDFLANSIDLLCARHVANGAAAVEHGIDIQSLGAEPVTDDQVGVGMDVAPDQCCAGFMRDTVEETVSVSGPHQEGTIIQIIDLKPAATVGGAAHDRTGF